MKRECFPVSLFSSCRLEPFEYVPCTCAFICRTGVQFYIERIKVQPHMYLLQQTIMGWGSRQSETWTQFRPVPLSTAAVMNGVDAIRWHQRLYCLIHSNERCPSSILSKVISGIQVNPAISNHSFFFFFFILGPLRKTMLVNSTHL